MFYRRLAEQVKHFEDEREVLRRQESAAREEAGRLDAEQRTLKEALVKEQEYGSELLAQRTRWKRDRPSTTGKRRRPDRKSDVYRSS